MLHLILAELFIAVPIAFSGWVMAGDAGLVGGLIFVLLGTLLAWSFQERIAYVLFPSRPASGEALQRTLELAIRIHPRIPVSANSIPVVRVIPDPQVRAFLIRGIFGPGVIFLSQGALSRLNERELRDLLGEAHRRLRLSKTLFASYCFLLGRVVEWFCGAKPLTPLGALRSLLFVPIRDALFRAAQSTDLGQGACFKV